MGKGETDYEIWGLKPATGKETLHPFDATSKLYLAKRIWFKITSCDTQAAAIRKVSRLRWPKTGIAIVPMRRKVKARG